MNEFYNTQSPLSDEEINKRLKSLLRKQSWVLYGLYAPTIVLLLISAGLSIKEEYLSIATIASGTAFVFMAVGMFINVLVLEPKISRYKEIMRQRPYKPTGTAC